MAGRKEHSWRLELSLYFSTFKAGELMRNIFQLKQAWDHRVLSKWCVTRGNTFRNNTNYSCVCAFVYVTVSSMHNVSAT